ncbi:hypothetical protein PV325_008522 [Microctonus aethiopoides]|nr:hypothetical protein PV325_008522 [Microctonus aethiopoides]KAK0093603.1 hypothetical protein PV326_013125 [Microctonus aethiopoides]
MLSRRACSESGVHPDVNVVSGVSAAGNWLNDCGGSGNSGGAHGHLWGKRQRGQTSGFVLGHANSCTTQPIILRTRRSWPVAPIQCRRYFKWKWSSIVQALSRSVTSTSRWDTLVGNNPTYDVI